MFGSNRTLAVNVKANVTDYVGNMRQAGAATSDFTKQAARSAKEHRAAWSDVGATTAGAAVAVGAAVFGAVKSYADFDKTLSQVRAVSGTSAQGMKELSAAALQAGKDTVFSASEAAQAEAELAKVGLTAKDIVGGALTGALNLAAAGQLDLAAAAQIAGQTMKTFKLAASDVPAIADALAAGANKSAAGVSDLAQALAQGGQVAQQAGMSMQDTVGVLAAFADNALMGSDAGTSLKTMLQRLSNPTAEAAATMRTLGIDAYDASGNFVGLQDIAGQLQKGMSGLTEEQRNAAAATIFGSDAVRAAGVLYNLGSDGVKKYVDGVRDVGAASRVAKVQTDNLAGDIERLRGAIETGLIESGGSANDVLRSLTKGAAGAVEQFERLPGPVKEGGVVVGLLATGVLAVSAALLTVLPRIVATKAALLELGVTGTRVRGAMTGLASAVGKIGTAVAAAGALDALIRRGDAAAISVDRTTTALLELSDAGSTAALDKAFQDLSNYGEDDIKGLNDALERLADPGLNTRLNKLASTVSFGLVNSGQEGIVEQFNRIGESLAQMVDSGNAEQASLLFDDIAKRAQAAGMSTDELSQLMPAYQDALARVSNQQQTTSGSSDALRVSQLDLAAGIEATDTAADKAAKRLQFFKDEIDGLNDPTLTLRDAQVGWRQSVDDATNSLKENGRTLSLNTPKGRANASALTAMARAALEQGKAVLDATGNNDLMRGSLIKSKAELQRVAEKFTGSRVKAQELADALIHIPSAHVEVTATGFDTVGHKIDTLITKIRSVDGRVVDVHARYDTSGRIAKAAGGLIPGPSSTADDIPAWVSSGEYVVRASATSSVGVAALDHINRTGALPAYAAGGHVTTSSAGRWVSAPASVTSASSSGRPVVVEQHDHYHLDSAAAASTATGYALAVERVKRRQTRVATRYGAPRS